MHPGHVPTGTELWPNDGMKSAVRLVQISDCHLPREPGIPYRGGDAHAGLAAVLPRVAAWAPELLLATGDLTESADDSAYAFLAARLGELGVPVLAVPGNHDEPERMARWLPSTATGAPLVHDAGRWRLVLLNSVIPRAVPGQLEESTLAALEEILAGDGRPVLIALHHQPLPVGSPWIDRYPLQQPEAFRDIVCRHPAVRAVCWGHVHQAFDLHQDGVRWLACPSTAANSLPGHERFTPDPAGPACRWLELHPDGTLTTGLL